MNKLDKRLSAVASFVRDGSYLADIGTDHAYLPIYCVKKGKSISAIASDINEKPYLTAKSNVAGAKLSDKIKCVQAYGFDGMEDYLFTDVAVCGMGGELIRDIIKNGEYSYDRIKSNAVRLILQPMTMTAVLRGYLYDNGYDIVGESTVYDDGRYYNILCAEYTGIIQQADSFRVMFGDIKGEYFESNFAFTRYISKESLKYKRIAAGKKSAGLDVSFENEIIEKLEAVIK